jgi:NTP pyrophosphatase (non-canonical NTP hydrolase)
MTPDMSFNESVELAKSIIERFEKIEGKSWGAEGAVIELQKQVGELSKLIMNYEGYYFKNREKLDKHYESDKEKIGDELADILYAIIRISKHYNIDLLGSHIKARKDEDEFLKTKGV